MRPGLGCSQKAQTSSRIHLMVSFPSMLYLLWTSAAIAIQEFPSLNSRIHLMVSLAFMLYL
jgi:hypothetical protein